MILVVNYMLLIWQDSRTMAFNFLCLPSRSRFYLDIRVRTLSWLCLTLLEYYMRKKDFRSIHGVSFISKYLVAFKSSGIRVIE